MSLSNYALELQSTSDIVCAYASGARTLQAQLSGDTPIWWTLGSFEVPEGVGARLAVIGCCTPDTRVEVALFAPSKIVESSVILLSETDTRSVSDVFSLVTKTTYLVAARCYGTAVDLAHFGIVRNVSLGNV